MIFLLGMMAGAVLCVAVQCLCVMAKQADKNNRKGDNNGKGN